MLSRIVAFALAALLCATPASAQQKDLHLVPDDAASAAPSAPASPSPSAGQEPFSAAGEIWPSPESPAPGSLTVQPSPASPQAPVAALSIKASMDRTGEVAVGDSIKVTMQPTAECYVYVIGVGTSGQSDLLFPNKKETDNHFAAGQERTIPGADAGYSVKVGGPAGTETVIVLASPKPVEVYQHLAAIAPRKQAEALTLTEQPVVVAQKDLTLVETPAATATVRLDDFFAALEKSGQVAQRKDLAHTILTLTVK